MQCLTETKCSKPCTVLIVDDNKLVLTMETILCTKAGFTVTTANSANEAFHKINSSIDLILTDIEMPSMNGDQLAKKIHEKYPNILIFGITSMTPNAVCDIDKSNFEILLEKPLKFEICQWLLSKSQQQAS